MGSSRSGAQKRPAREVRHLHGLCESGKISYPSKKDVKKMIKQNPRFRDLSIYFHEDCGTWHAGHLPKEVKRGSSDRRENPFALG